MKKILIIEDNQEVRENVAEILELSNYEVFTAENGKVGVQLANKNKPDLIICDVMMPELDGFGVLHILSKKPQTASIPFIFLTAKAEKTDFRKGMNLGADDYITKPFDDAELLDAIEIRLKKSAAIHDAFTKGEDGFKTFIDEARGHQEMLKLSEDRIEKNYRKKDPIFMEGDYPNQLYYITKGKVKIAKTNEDGKEYVITIRKTGDFIGYLALMKNERYQISAYALEDTSVSVIPKKDFFTLLHGNRDVANKFIKLLSENILEKEEQLLSLAYNSVRKRVAEALVRLHNEYKIEGRMHTEIIILREDLANMVGTAKETVIRTLADFKDEKLVKIKGSRITILNLYGLENIIG
jgi:CRP-like cAMP-binding protein/CheY-like chemotaxis protein